MPDSPRIAELRRRVHADPASIAFAQLAEEYRRAGQYEEAVNYCRSGLARHPGYLSARVTLGRALSELGVLDEAAAEFDIVLTSAPDNLAAIRGLAEIRQRQGNLVAALDYYKRALALARFDPALEETVDRIGREMGDVNASASFDDLFPLANALTQKTLTDAPSAPSAPSARGMDLIDFDALLASLGVPDASPPPIMEMLLSGSSTASRPAEPTSNSHSAERDSTQEVLGELESWLHVLQSEGRTPAER